MSPSSSSTAVKHGPCLLTLKKKKKGIQAFETKCLRKLLRYLLLGAQDQRLGAERDQLSCRSTGTSFGNCQGTDTCMVRACHTPRQPLQNPEGSSGRLGGWSTPRRGRQRKWWLDNIKEWTHLPMPEVLTRASCRKDWKRLSAESPNMTLPHPQPPRFQSVKGLD